MKVECSVHTARIVSSTFLFQSKNYGITNRVRSFHFPQLRLWTKLTRVFRVFGVSCLFVNLLKKAEIF